MDYIKRPIFSCFNNNVIIPGGAQDTGDGRFNIEVPEFLRLPRCLQHSSKVTPSAVVTLGDLGEIRRTFKDYHHIQKLMVKMRLRLK